MLTPVSIPLKINPRPQDFPPPCHLENYSSKLPPMDNITTGLLLTLGTIVIWAITIRWWRYRRAAKLADKLLAEVIRGKDAFRR
jgi:hypothetical protein